MKGFNGIPIMEDYEKGSEVLSFHFDDGFLDTRCRSSAPEMSEQESGHDEKKRGGRTENEFLGLSAGWGYLIHGASATLGKFGPPRSVWAVGFQLRLNGCVVRIPPT